MFCRPDLAARIDRAEGRLCAAIAGAIAGTQPDFQPLAVPVGGGLAVFAGPESPTNKMIGIGFDGPVADAELAAVEAAFSQRRARLQAEVSTLAEPGLHAHLNQRGYAAVGFENVLGHPLGAAVPSGPPGIIVDRLSPDELDLLVEVMVEGFAHPDEGGVGGDAIPPADEIRRWFRITMSAGFTGFVARLDGEVAGGGSLRFDEGIAQFSGAATLPRFRRRGVQTALLRARLAAAAGAGCDVGVVVTQPASKSQQNVQREGFALLYARQLLVKAGGA